MSASWEEAYKGVEPSEKSKEIASEKIFGYQPFTAEQIETARHKVGIGLKGVASGILGSLEDISEFAQGIVGVKKPVKFLPSSQDVGEFFEKASGEKFSPETTGEEFLEKGTTFLGSLLGLGGPLKGGSKIGSLGRTALGAFVPAGVATVAEKENLPSWMQAASTIGSSFLIHRLTGKGLKDMEKALYKKAESLLPEGASVDASQLESKIGRLETGLRKGLEAPSESAVLKTLDKFRNKIQDGEIAIDELTAARRSLVEMTLTDEVRKSPRARTLLKSVFKDIDDTIGEYGKKNPEYVETYRQANSLHRGMQESKKIGNWIKQHPYLATAAGSFLGVFSPLGLGTSLAAGKSLAIGSALARNPGLRKAYWEVLKNASKQEVKGTATALKKFNSQLKKTDLEETPNQKSDWEEAYESM